MILLLTFDLSDLLGWHASRNSPSETTTQLSKETSHCKLSTGYCILASQGFSVLSAPRYSGSRVNRNPWLAKIRLLRRILFWGYDWLTLFIFLGSKWYNVLQIKFFKYLISQISTCKLSLWFISDSRLKGLQFLSMQIYCNTHFLLYIRSKWIQKRIYQNNPW